MRVAAAALGVACLVASIGGAAACTCRQPRPGDADFDVYRKDPQEWSFARAAIVVRGRILSVKTPGWWSSDGTVRATMRVTAVLKGVVPPGDLTLLTGSGGGDCGFGSDFEDIAGSPREVALEVVPVTGTSEDKGAYGVGLCRYSDWTTANGK